MHLLSANRTPLGAAVTGLVLLALAARPLRGQSNPWDCLPLYSGWPCPAPQPGLPPHPPQPGRPQPQPPAERPTTERPTTERPTTEQPQPPDQTGQADQQAADTGERGGAGAEAAGALAAPNMNGNLLMAGRSVSFAYGQGGTGLLRVFNTGSTNIVNPKVADNNSPLPQDRIAFRYNFFHDSLAVTGIGNQPLPPITNAANFTLATVATTTRTYDVNQYTFQFEKTFLDGGMSLEFRLPFQNTLSSNLNLTAGTVTGIKSMPTPPGLTRLGPSGNVVPVDPSTTPTVDVLTVDPTSGQTLGAERTELGNLSLILKGLVYQTRTIALSGGLGVGIPTANNERVRVTDFGGSLSGNFLEVERVRQFDVKNETWDLTPFLAALYTPTNRFFAQGFLQFDVPLNTSKVTYSEAAPLLLNGASFAPNPNDPSVRMPPFTVTDHLREQALMHVDVGTGYWVVRNPEARWVTGLAPTLELHYTTTLNSADIVNLPRDSSAIPISSFFDPTKGFQVNTRSEVQPTVGNRRGHVDILDLTAGTTLYVANRATLATAVAVPLRTGDNRTFDWELQVQLNYYFGGPSRRGTFAPTF
jgi:hypothetical protein